MIHLSPQHKNRTAFIILIELIVSALGFGPSEASAKTMKEPHGVTFTSQGLNVRITFFTPSIVRVCKTPLDHAYQKQSLVVIKKPEQVDYNLAEEKDRLVLATSQLQIKVNLSTGGIEFLDSKGKRMTLNKDYGTSFAVNDRLRPDFYTVRESFLLEPDEPIYGIGQIMDGKFNRRNASYHLQNENMFTYSPYFLSPKGYAVYFDNYSISDIIDTPQDFSYLSIGHCSDYYVILGPTTDRIISGLRQLTGKAPMLPLWAYGFFQSRERYRTQQESLDVLEQFRKSRIPVDCIIQDWRYWPQYQHSDSLWNCQAFDSERFPSPSDWVRRIHGLHAKLLIVTWPGFGGKTQQRQELDANNLTLNFLTFPPNSDARPYDPFSPKARDIFWKYLNKGVFSYIGNDGWWLDSTEPDHIDRKEADYDQPTFLGPYRTVKNAFSFMHNLGIATHQKDQTKDKRVVILTRSGFIGQQRCGSNTWSGDVESTWEMLEKQIPAALNFTLMGLPNWNSDIGGFYAHRWVQNGGNKNPEFQELYVRWMQFGLFCPMMRSHGTGLPREIWQFGNRGDWCYDAQEKAIRLRYRLLPYIYSTSYDVSANDGTFMRPLFMDFPSDKHTLQIGNTYLFGRSLLVSPVTKYQVSRWDVYLPKGTGWWNFWTGQMAEGGQTISCPVTKDIIPVYVKAGTILPVGPDVQYANEKKWDNLEIRVYPGDDGTFTLYEDEGDNYNYEQGRYSLIKFTWNEQNQELTISSRKGQFKGMLKSRRFRIRLMQSSLSKERSVSYSGKTLRINL